MAKTATKSDSTPLKKIEPAKKKSLKTKIVLPNNTEAEPKARKLTPPDYTGLRVLKFHRKIKHPGSLPSAWRIAKRAGKILQHNWRLFLGITLIYTLLTILLVRGLSSGANLQSVKTLLGGDASKVAGGLGVLALLVTSSGNNSSPTAGVYQTFLAIFVSLAVVWSFRQVLAGAEVHIRDAFYRGMYPLVPVLLVLLTIGIQLLPLIIGAELYTLVISNGIAAAPIERVIWFLVFCGLAMVSFYMITSSIFALYIAALPDMTPLKALRSARALVRYRRWTVLRKLLFLPLILLILSVAIMLPIILLATPLAPWAFFVLTMVGLPVIHAYMYTLYRELLT